MAPYLSVSSLQVRIGEHLAVQDLSFSAERGELLTLLGPSGCGKTTTLRAIAGFVEPSGGHILVAGSDITVLPAHRRNIGMVFQSYALFPHLTVFDNVGFGLRMRQVGKPQQEVRVNRALEMVGLEGFGDRYSAQLSGGQQQRVALARALVIEPSILLLDEPLSNLDANLRADLRDEIRALQKRLNILTILVTHDQAEALAISDRVAVMSGGRLVAVGSPESLCDRPTDAFTAGFLGGRTVIAGETRDGVFRAAGIEYRGAPEGATNIVLRGPRLRLGSAAGDGGELSIAGEVVARVYVGDFFETEIETPSGRVRVIVPSDEPPPAVGESCNVCALPGSVSFIS